MNDLNRILKFFRPLFSDPSQVVSDPWDVDVGTPTPTPTAINCNLSDAAIDAGGTVAVTGSVLDQNNNPMANKTVTVILYQLSSGDDLGNTGSSDPILQKSARTDENGNYATSLTIANIGTYYINAQVGSLTSATQTITVETPSPVPSSLSLNISPTEVEVGDTVSFTGVLSDQFGNAINDAPVYVDIKNEDGSLLQTLQTQTQQDLTGGSMMTPMYQVTYSFNNAGIYSVQARAPTSYALGVAFPNTDTRILRVYEKGERPDLPEWLLPAAAIGTAALVLGVIALNTKKR